MIIMIVIFIQSLVYQDFTRKRERSVCFTNSTACLDSIYDQLRRYACINYNIPGYLCLLGALLYWSFVFLKNRNLYHL
jgi:hypothetical protein